MKQKPFALSALFLSIFLVSCSSSNQNEIQKITILHTNDHHGRFWQNEIGEYGLAAQKTVVDKIKKEVKDNGGVVLLLSAGDINTGVPESDLLQAEPDFKGMNLVGYDAMALGNHEFDNPISVLRQQEKWANFPLLSANIYDKKTKKRLFKPYQIFNQNGVKIAVIGLTTEDTATIGNPAYLKGIEFKKPTNEAKILIEELDKTEKPDMKILVTHMGHYDNGKSGSNAPGDVEMARNLPKGYADLIVGGHSQDPVCMESENKKQTNYIPGSPCFPDRQNNTWIVQAHEWGKFVGRADFELKDGEITLKKYELIPINLQKETSNENGEKSYSYYTHKIEQNPEMLELLTPFQEKGQEQLMKKVGYLNGDLDGNRNIVRNQQAAIGHFVSSALIEKTNADFAIINGGTIRDSLKSGDLTYKDLLKVFPFGNAVSYYDIPGNKLPEYVQKIAEKTKGSGGYAQFTNISFLLNNNGIHNIKIKGKPLDKNKTYRVTMLNFSAIGGDGYPTIDKEPGYVDTGYPDVEALVEYVKKHSPIDAKNYSVSSQVIDARQ